MADFQKIWRTLRIDIEIARTYDKAIATRDQTPSSALGGRLPWVDQLLATLLYIRAMEIHDDALVEAFKARNELPLPKKPKRYDNTLNGRLDYCIDHWPGFDATLRQHGGRRNDFAHDADQHASWKELDTCVAAVQASLLSMGAIPEPIISVSINYGLVSSTRTSRVWDVKVGAFDPKGKFHQTWRTTESVKVESSP